MTPTNPIAHGGVLIEWARYAAVGLELFGVIVIVLSVLVAAAGFIRSGSRAGDWPGAYDGARANLGRGILLGLELLVGADIIATVTSPLTVESVGLLAGIVAIRTFLSFALETEIEGRFPWRRHTAERAHPDQPPPRRAKRTTKPPA